MNAQIFLTVLAFLLTIIMIFWRPRGMNEAIPASIGAIIVILSGSVTLADLGNIASTVTGAAITIMATIVMAIVLESFGFFNWVAIQLYNRSKGSGMRLFWNTNLLCFLMTLFFNNDGSILITTPILILLLNKLRLKPHQKIPYLLSGALIATASSAPIGVSNIVNLIALKIVHMTLYMHTAMMFVPGTIGLLFMATLLFLVLKKDIPEKLPVVYIKLDKNYVITSAHPLKSEMDKDIEKAQSSFMKKILLFVFAVRCSLFIASYIGIPVEIVAVLGSLVLLGWRWYKLKLQPLDILVKTPWHILVFAFSMYVIVYGLHNLGFTKYIIDVLSPIVSSSIFNASLVMGFVLTVLSNIFNNHPALMIGTLTLTEMGLDPITLKTVYLANIIGSDIGSLLFPMGTLASLIWMHILKKSKIKMSWSKYMKVTFIVIPPTVLFTLTVLYFWVRFVFANHV